MQPALQLTTGPFIVFEPCGLVWVPYSIASPVNGRTRDPEGVRAGVLALGKRILGPPN